jgi:hypothetical protein
MLAPTQKSNDTIQLIVTRSCSLLTCSNCTQLLPFRKDVAHMSIDVFRLALRSLEGWPGIRGVFGGNPTNHPRFADLCQVLIEEVPDQRQRGLWCNDLLKHGQIVRDTFYPLGRFNMNAHADEAAAAEIDRWLPGKLIASSRNNAAWHSPILMNHADYGIGYDEWVGMREKCDINQRWSSAIAERDGKPYAYFCEVGAALDGIRGENHGIEAVPGWWKFGMDHFAGQVKGCCDRGCGVPLKLKGHLDRDDTYDVSPSFVPFTVKGKNVTIANHETLPGEHVQQPTDYLRLRTPVSV